MTLRETQAILSGLITEAADPDPPSLDRIFRGTDELAPFDRIAIYRGMYRERLVDALRETFPNLARFLGERFPGLGEEYVRRHPSEHHDVGKVGRRLAAFLARYPDPERPDLAELAELEWARNEVFFAPDAGATGPEALAGLSPEAAGAARLSLSPTLRVLTLDHDVLSLWRRLERGEPPEPPIPGPTAAAVWRRGFEVFHCALSLHEAAALSSAREGAPLAAICAHFADRPDPAGEAHGAISTWFVEEWVASVSAPS